jgi:Iodothyronine deiodinase
VYILEAHANDEWPVGSQQFDYQQATTMEMRAKAASDFKNNLGVTAPVVLDNVDNTFEKAYAPWPFRFFVVQSGRILMKPTPIDGTYDLCDLWDLLDKY